MYSEIGLGSKCDIVGYDLVMTLIIYKKCYELVNKLIHNHVSINNYTFITIYS